MKLSKLSTKVKIKAQEFRSDALLLGYSFSFHPKAMTNSMFLQTPRNRMHTDRHFDFWMAFLRTCNNLPCSHVGWFCRLPPQICPLKGRQLGMTSGNNLQILSCTS